MTYSIENIVRMNKNAGYHFFDKDAMRSFGSRVSDQVYQREGGIFFVTSEKCRYSDEPRGYKARQFLPETGQIKSVSDEWTTKYKAHKAAKDASMGLKD